MASWGPWFLWGLFAAILVWEEVWDLPNTAYLSAWLLIIITVGDCPLCILFSLTPSFSIEGTSCDLA